MQPSVLIENYSLTNKELGLTKSVSSKVSSGKEGFLDLRYS